ncbi:MAG: prohibitin family protein [Candidatus Melainabacteria bacterium]|nr:prohibitin family protein [Candidatus Melainabacteria bacterium]
MKNQVSIIVVFLVLAVLSQSVKVIPEGRTGVIFNLKGGVQENALGEGLHFLIPFMQTLVVFDTRIITYSFSNNVDDETRLGEPIVAKTQDGQIVGIEASIVTQMIKDQAPQVYQTLRTDYEPVLKSKIGKIMQEIIAKHVADALYTDETRRKVTAELSESLSVSFKQSGFELKDVFLRKIDFSKEYIDAIERKQIALQKAQLAQIKKAIAVKEKQIEIIKGEAIAKQVEIKGRAIQANPRVAELEYLDRIEQSEKKVPVIMGLRGNTFVNLDKMLP